MSKNSACQKPLTCSFNSVLEVNCRKGFSHLFLFQRIWLLVVSLLATYVFDSPKWLRNFLLHIFREGKHHHFSGWYSNFVYKHTKSWLSLSKVAYISHKWLVAPVFWGQRKSELITIKLSFTKSTIINLIKNFMQRFVILLFLVLLLFKEIAHSNTTFCRVYFWTEIFRKGGTTAKQKPSNFHRNAFVSHKGKMYNRPASIFISVQHTWVRSGFLLRNV